jgi:pyruvate kinase
MKPVFTKIVATLGPSSSTPEKISALIKAGVDVFRLNFSHGTQAEQKERLNIIRDLSRKMGRHISIVADMQGPKLRVGQFRNKSVLLKKGQNFPS